MDICLITGSAGLIGSEASFFFSKKKFKIIGVDNNLRYFFFGKNGSTTWNKKRLIENCKNYYHYNVDIRNKKKINDIFKKYKNKIKLIIHCAAQPSHDWAYKDPLIDYEVNSSATFNLLNLTKEYCPESSFIYISTNKVYGDNPNKLQLVEKEKRYEIKKNHQYYRGIDETMSIDSCVHSFFGASKLSADLFVQEYGKNLGLNTVCFRAGCLTGPAHSGAELHGFLSYLIKTILSKKTYNVFGYKGKQVRDNLHSSDLVNAFWEYHKKPKKGTVYNIGGSRISNCSIIEASQLIEKITKIKPKLNFLKKNRTGDHQWWITNNKKFMKDFPSWKIKYDSEKIIREIITK